MIFIIIVLFNLVLVEAMTNLLTKSELFLPVRKYLFESNNRVYKFISKIVDCPYCTSVWVSLFCVCMLYLFLVNLLPTVFVLFFAGIVIHRLSNVLHCIIDRIDSNHRFGQGN